MTGINVARVVDARIAQSVDPQLQAIREQLQVIQRCLMPEESASHRFATQSRVAAYIAARRRRDHFFPKGLFADPAWDMLLDLWLAEERDTVVSISSLCLASCVPPTTALRWIAQLERAELIRRIADQTDGRRRFVVLSWRGRKAMAGYLGTMSAGALPVPMRPDARHGPATARTST